MSANTSITPASIMQSSWGEGLQPAKPQPGLYIVATPIGNLRDITLRALDILSCADIILAEDTRQTVKLLNAYGIKNRLTAYHDHNAAKQIPFVMDALASGKIVAQVSDAGTPLISDPGFKLVRAAAEARFDIVPVPGASALLAGLMSAGLPSDNFMFAGFLPAKSSARKRTISPLKNIQATLIVFESGNRLAASLGDMREVLGDRKAVIARELTKKYEEIRRGSFTELLDSIDANPPKGEIVVLIAPPNGNTLWTDAQIDQALREHISELGVKRASARIAELSGWAKRDVYQRALLSAP